LINIKLKHHLKVGRLFHRAEENLVENPVVVQTEGSQPLTEALFATVLVTLVYKRKL
jgi:hypothetical protein